MINKLRHGALTESSSSVEVTDFTGWLEAAPEDPSPIGEFEPLQFGKNQLILDQIVQLQEATKEWSHVKQACVLRDTLSLTRWDDIYQALRSSKNFDGTSAEAKVAADQNQDFVVRNGLLYRKYFDHDS